MDPHDLARRAIGEKSILDAAAEMNAATREELAASLSRGTKHTIFTDDETVELGQVWMSNPKGSWRVTDEAALLAWVKANHPTALVEVRETRISPAWLKGLLSDPVTADGEIPPGVDQVAGRPTLTVKPSAAAKDIARSLVLRELEP